MSHEIIPVDATDVFLDMDPILPEDSPTIQFTRSLTFQEQDVCEPYDSETKLPETLAPGIERFLRVANLLESEEPRIAYLCRFYAFEVAHRIDPTSTGRGVRQFKDSLLRRIQKDSEWTSRRSNEKNDERELKRVYHAYKEYIIRHGVASNSDNSQREKLINARRIASVLYEILKKVFNRGTYGSPPGSIQLNWDEESGELLDKVTLMEEIEERNLDGTFVDEKAELIVEKFKALEEERLTQLSQGDDSVQSNHLNQAKIDAIYKEEIQIKKDIIGYGSMEDDGGPSSEVPSSLYKTQEKLNEMEKKIEEMDLKLKDVDFWTSMMQNMFPDQVPPSMRANQTENSNNDEPSL